MDDYRERVKAAILKNAKRNMPSTIKKSKNNKPEKIVEKSCLQYLRSIGASIDVVESKATYSLSAKSYRSSPIKAGFPDLVGCDQNGILLSIELKAPGRRSTLRPAQRAFLIEKINHNAFAVCVDSVELLKNLYDKWSCVTGDPAKKFLLDSLPKEKLEDSPNAPLFDLQE